MCRQFLGGGAATVEEEIDDCQETFDLHVDTGAAEGWDMVAW
jgi:hypothetical protein